MLMNYFFSGLFAAVLVFAVVVDVIALSWPLSGLLLKCFGQWQESRARIAAESEIKEPEPSAVFVSTRAAREMLESIADGDDAAWHLVRNPLGDRPLYFHSLNVHRGTCHWTPLRHMAKEMHLTNAKMYMNAHGQKHHDCFIVRKIDSPHDA